MNISSATSGIQAALQSVSDNDDLGMIMLSKAQDNEKMEGADAMALIQQATGKGGNVNALA